MNRRACVRIFALCLLVGLAAGPGLMAIEPQVATTGITWDLTAVSYDGARLVVSGPDGFYLARDFGDEEAPALSLFDEAGQPLPDGTYAWELTTAPRVDPEVREALRELRRQGLETGLAARAAGIQLPEGERQSGYFAVHGSRFVTDGAGSEAPLATTVPAEGREITERATDIDELCVGFGCTISLTYSDSNLVLRDTDTRLKFADTSTSSPFFSSSDWEIEINSADGGTAANYFGLNDCGYSSNEGGCASDLVFAVEAGARQNALYVEDDGQVGIGTSSPQRELHVVSSDSPAIRLDQDGTGAFDPYDWDLAGNEENFFLRDVTNNNTVPFRVEAGAEADTLVVGVDGEVAVNGALPSGTDYLTVHVTDSNGGITVESTDGNLPQLTLIEPDGKWRLRVNNMGNLVLTDATSGTSPLQIIQGSNNNLLNLNGSAVTVNGDFTITGVKNFVQAHPEQPGRSVYFAALEGPEAGTYYRGTAQTVNGIAVVQLPDDFSAVTEAEGLTVQITPVGGDHRFYVEERSAERLVIREPTGKASAEFDFLVQGVRLGYADYVANRPTPSAH